MIKQNSLQAYEAFKKSGALANDQREIYERLSLFGALTRRRFMDYLRDCGDLRLRDQAKARISGLIKLGYVVEVGKVKDPVTGRQAALIRVATQSEYEAFLNRPAAAACVTCPTCSGYGKIAKPRVDGAGQGLLSLRA